MATEVLVVDDSALMRRVISDIINSDPSMHVVGTARNGQDALQKIEQLKPDVITLDVEMPMMDGMETLKTIMAKSPLPVIMLSSHTQSGTDYTIKALQLGAIDFVPKPSGQISMDIDKVKEEIVKKIKIAAGTKYKLQNTNIEPEYNPIPPWGIADKVIDPGTQLNKLVLIGTSTGGPKALHQVLPKLPAKLNAGILVVQHMPPGFTKSLAERLNSLSQIKVKEAEDGELVLPGCAYITPGDYHLNVVSKVNGSRKELRIKLTQKPPRGGHRPSVDEMLESVAAQYWSHIVCVIMTGMGKDGTEGLKFIKDKGGRVIAEDQSSCVVYGMPKAAYESGWVDKVVPLRNISEVVLNML